MHPSNHPTGPTRQGGRDAILQIVLVVLLMSVVIFAALAGRGSDSDGSAGTSVAAGGSTASGTTNADTDQASSSSAGSDHNDGDASTNVGSGLDDADDPSPTSAPVPEPTRAIEDIPLDGPGTFTYAVPASPPIGAAPYIRYAVAVEDGSGVAADDVAALVASILSDERSWIGDGSTGFEQVTTSENVLFTLVVATPDTVDTLCEPLDTAGRYSCGRNGWIALNLLRWETAAEVWPSTLEIYRQYLVNHEVGHYLLGANHDNFCTVAGSPAPIMMQQSIDLLGCAPNG